MCHQQPLDIHTLYRKMCYLIEEMHDIHKLQTQREVILNSFNVACETEKCTHVLNSFNEFSIIKFQRVFKC